MLGISQCVDALSASAVRFTARATAVPDGDTLWVQPANGGRPRKLRLLGIDAPEVCQHGGEDARRALQQLVDDVQLQVDVRHTDDYGRGLARIHADGRDIAAVMVQRGHAWSSRLRRSAGPYAVQELPTHVAATMQSLAQAGDPVYRVTVKLKDQRINAYGTQHTLKPGMLAEADIVQDT